MGNSADVPKTPTLPQMCPLCTNHAATQIAGGASGVLFCDHRPNTPGAGMVAIVRVRHGKLMTLDLYWPRTRAAAIALMDAAEEMVTGKLNEHPPINH